MASNDTRGGDAIDSRAGWVVVALGFLLLVVLWGAVFTFTVYSGALATAFDLTAIGTSAVFSIGTAAFFVVGGSVGIVVARMPLRPVVAAAAVAVAAAVGLLQVVDSFLGLVAAFSLFGMAGGTTFVLTVSVVPQWFEAYEGTAIGITIAGNGLGVQVFPFVWLGLLARTDVRRAFLAVGAVAVALLLVATYVYRRPPGRRERGAVAVDPAWLRSIVGSPRFLAAWVGLVIAWSWFFVLSAGLVDVLTRAGIPFAVASTAFGLVGGVSVVSRVVGGGVADRVGPRVTIAGGIVLSAGGLLLLAGTTDTTTMYAALVVLGAGLGAIAALYAPIVIRAFGEDRATAVTGLFTFCSAAAGFVAPLAVNGVAGAVGGYDLPLVALAVVTVAGAWLFYWGTDPTVSS